MPRSELKGQGGESHWVAVVVVAEGGWSTRTGIFDRAEQFIFLTPHVVPFAVPGESLLVSSISIRAS